MNRWFRMYDEILDDPKVQKLSAEAFRAWVNLLCLASRNGGSFMKADVAFALRTSALRAEALLTTLVSAGLMELAGVSVIPHNWTERQYISDSSATRVKRFRERRSNVTCNVTPPLHETAPDSDTDSDTEKTPPVIPLKGDGVKEDASRGTRLPTDWQPSAEDRAFAERYGFTGERLERLVVEFRNFWVALPGARGRKLSWSRTWQNRVLDQAGRAHPGQRPQSVGLVAVARKILAEDDDPNPVH